VETESDRAEKVNLGSVLRPQLKGHLFLALKYKTGPAMKKSKKILPGRQNSRFKDPETRLFCVF
jgi:hypothetical protein